MRDPCAVALIDRHGRVRDASPELIRLLARSSVQDLIGEAFAGLMRDERESLAGWCDALLAGDDREPIECRIALPGGLDVPVRLTGSKLAGEGEPEALVYLTALTPAGRGGDEPLPVVLDRLHDAVIAYDREWRYSYLNRSAERYIGLPREALLGKVIWEAFPAVLGTAAETQLRRAAASDGPSEFEVLGPVTKHTLVVRAYPSEAGLVCYYRDVTAEREAVAALRASEEKYRSIFENSLAGMLLTRESGEILAANPAACQMLGRTEAEICAEGRGGVVDTSDPKLAGFLAERARSGKAVGQLRLRRKDGSTFPVQFASALFEGAPGSRLTSLSFVDLSERERAERALEFLAEAGKALSASLDFEATLQALTGLVVPALADLCAVDLLEGAQMRRAAVSHRSPEAAPLLDRLRSAEFVQETPPILLEVLRTGEPLLVSAVDTALLSEANRMGPFGEIARALEPRAVILVPMSVGGRCVGVLSMVTVGEGRPYDPFDLSVARRLAENAALAIENARHFRAAVEARQLRDDMLGIVSHDLRSPLNAIELTAVMMGRRCKEERPSIERITRVIRHANQLIEDLLIASRVEEGHLTLDRRRERVGALFDEVLELHSAQAEAASVRLVATVGEAVPELYVDRHRVVRLLGNLVSNALKFTPAGGSVSLDARVDREGEVVLSVTDTGRGIPADDLPHLFDRFWQGSQARRADAGLGLAIVKGIAEAHGGSVTVQSELGRGTRFEVTIPTRRP
ncbi:MAG: PAS domain S-box protein [Myxococcaceae bacterium]|nr:MAG: PAS domain S-box protein [Myxococcaceae bacterium]